MLQNGEIVEQGRHNELLQIEEGVYRKLWNEQLNKITDESSQSIEEDVQAKKWNSWTKFHYFK